MRTLGLLPILALSLLVWIAPSQGETTLSNTGSDQEELDALLMRFSEDPDHFTQTDGEALYRTTCQACHMEDGRGDSGAGAHPPIADNPKMISKHFLAGVILTGYHGMPGFAATMSDEQVAAITNYVRSSFGNSYSDPISPEQVRALRPTADDE